MSRSGVFEVHIGESNRWKLDKTYNDEQKATARAKELMGKGTYDAVRVVIESGRSTKVVFQEEAKRGRAITVTPVDEAPFCSKIDDMYAFPARRCCGRVMRKFLDHNGLTALQLAFSSGYLRMLIRKDTLLAQAISIVAGVQARQSGEKPSIFSDFLWTTIRDMQERARDLETSDSLHNVLNEQGIEAVIAKARQEYPAMADFYIRGALAGLMGDAGDWDGRLELLISQLEPLEAGQEGIHYCDEVVAEVLDGAEAIKEVLRGQRDLSTALRSLSQLALGNLQTTSLTSPTTDRLNAIMANKPMKLTRQVLLERVQRELASVKPLTKEGGRAERDAYSGVFDDLVTEEGVAGGTVMAEALIKRARLALSTEQGQNLNFEQGVAAVAELPVARASRVSFLLEISQCDISDDDQMAVVSQLSSLIQKMPNAGYLLHEGAEVDEVVTAAGVLKDRFALSGVADLWRDRLVTKLDELAREYKAAGGTPSNGKLKGVGSSGQKGAKNMANQPLARRTVRAGDFIFHQGEPGDEAYLIGSGKVEIIRRTGNQEVVVATVSKGNIIGEMALIDDQPRMASAKAIEDTTVTVIPSGAFKARLDRLGGFDPVMRRLLDIFVDRIRVLTRA